MAEFLLSAAFVILTVVAAGLLRLLYGPARADRMMSAQLLGTGGIAILLLLDASGEVTAGADVALTLALLSSFASAAFVKAAADRDAAVPREEAGT